MQLANGPFCWLFQVLLLEATLHTLGDGDVPLLDVVAYGGYTYAAVSVSLLARIVCVHSFYAVTLWECFCMGMFFVKIMKRILIAVCRNKKLWEAFKQAPLSLASSGHCPNPIALLAR